MQHLIRPQLRHTVAYLAAISVLFLSTLFLASKTSASIPFPIGTPNTHQPSGMAPPSANSLPGFRLTYVNNFNVSGLPTGWIAFSGHPGGLPTASFSVRHVTVSGGLLQLKTYRDHAFNNKWTMGGLCQCGRSSLYGAFFARSRITGPGANNVELLWPDNNSWPPEIDFNENMNHVALTTSSTHWSASNKTDFATLRINMLEWHTWGVVWTPARIVFIVDGQPWHEFAIAKDIPHLPMVLDFEQRAVCPSRWECPTSPSALLIDWVAEYQMQH